MPTTSPGPDRRSFLTYLGAVGLTAGAADVLWARSTVRPLRKRDLAAAERLCGLEFTDDERELMLEDLVELTDAYQKIREVPLENATPPALTFVPDQSEPRPTETVPARWFSSSVERPADDAELAFLGLRDLGALLRRRDVTSTELTRLALDRLRAHGPELECVIATLEEPALEAAQRCDDELRAGRDLGPLHGIPWGAKDLLATRHGPTTWGATPFREQSFPQDAAVVERLEEAGAVLVAKLTLGALAWGDVWFDGKTRNPWNREQGSSGSSAGSASATSAGLVPFAIGSETWGSIVSPSTRCGVTGLRPTFGRVSRHGAMALSWTMDKLGPIGRSVEDCALVFEAIAGTDPRDPSSVAATPFRWNPDPSLDGLRVGWVPTLFEAAEAEDEADEEWREFDRRTLEEVRALGLDLVEVELPDFPVEALSFILTAEASAAFDELTRTGRDDELVRQVRYAWPNSFRQGRFIPAVEYIQANRLRTLLGRQLVEKTRDVDVWIAPSFGGDHLLMTNLTGQPCVVAPNGFRSEGTPTSITFTGQLFGEQSLLRLARAWQESTTYHRHHPAPPWTVKTSPEA